MIDPTGSTDIAVPTTHIFPTPTTSITLLPTPSVKSPILISPTLTLSIEAFGHPILGEAYELKCITNQPIIDLKWFFQDGSLILASTTIKIGDTLMLNEGYSLSIYFSSLKIEDFRKYYCTSKSSNFTAETNIQCEVTITYGAKN